MKKELFEGKFKGKRATVMGLGLLGRGVGDTRFLAKHCKDLIVTDRKDEKELAASLSLLKEFDTITYRLGEHAVSDFEGRDFILKAAGVPYDSEYIAHAKECGVPIYMSAALVVDIAKKALQDVTVIGVTGTRGKSTTTELIAHILEEGGRKVHRGGNLRGLANLPLLEEIEKGDCLVLELDSWQLQGFGDLGISPDIAVFTSFLDDHMNYYKNDRELYFKDKANLFLHQKESCLFASEQAAEEIRRRYIDQNIIVPEVKDYHAAIIGEHNNTSISLALAVAEKLGIPVEKADIAVHTFAPVSGRLENMGIYSGVTVYNDNNATTPDAVIAGIQAVYEKHGEKPILIMGGSDKGLSFDALEKEVKEKTKACILLSGTGTDKLSLPKDQMYDTLEECIKTAFLFAQTGDVILFSPGFASFSHQFNNEYERGDRFAEEVKKYA
jgi:UDP-N-acetylmuramoylalanine--D-glutamate ligase